MKAETKHDVRTRVAWWTMAVVILGLARLGLAAAGATLVGIVRDPDNLPLPDAGVFVYSAKPRHGPATIMATAYPDCGKKARTDANGQFQISGVDSELIYRLLVVAPGHRPHFI